MRNIGRQTIRVVLILIALPLAAATPSDFYSSLLRRGISAFEASRYEEAARQLRLAAFGFLDSVEHYQTAQVYLALSHERLQQQDRTREAVRKVLQAEKIEKRFGGLQLGTSIRREFDAIAERVLTPAEVNLLRTSPPRAATAATTPATTPTTTGPPANTSSIPTTTATTTPPRPQREEPKPAPVVPPPAKPQTSTTTTNEKPKQVTSVTVPFSDPPAKTETKPKPEPAKVDPPKVVDPPKPVPQPQKPAPIPATSSTPTLTASEIASRLAAADRALGAANLTEARRIYRELLAVSTLERATILRIGEGLYRSRDFSPALTAFRRLGALRAGEEPYRYYIAVALYETGAYAEAKRELAAVLPYIEVTPDVARYRAKIEGSVH
ncbi:MAG: tetratricopeptide repeat protein [Thermoanaerobaculia bacterium]